MSSSKIKFSPIFKRQLSLSISGGNKDNTIILTLKGKTEKHSLNSLTQIP